MLALVKESKAPGAALKDVEIPNVLPDHILARVKATSICGTDVHIYSWNKWAASVAKPPKILGHEFAAEVIETGQNVTHFKKGDKISGETHIYCGNCYECKIGNFHLCENMKLRGVNTDGCFSEYVLISEKTAWKNDPALPDIVASAQEPLGNAVHSVFSGEVVGKSVVILGCGPIGLCAISLCKYAGAEKVLAVDLSEYRLDLAGKMGADNLISGKDARREISNIIPSGADIILEMSGSAKALDDGLKVARRGARVSLLGLPDDGVTIDLSNDVILKGLTLQGIFGRKIFATWELSSRLLKAGAVDLEKIITHKLKIQEYKEAFKLMEEGKCGKIVMTTV